MSYELCGIIHEGNFTSLKSYPSAVFHYYVHIPECYSKEPECGLILTHDGLNRADAGAAPFLIRKFEPKPIRVFTDYSKNEPDDYFGSSFVGAQNFERALRFSGYEFKCEYHPGEGHCSRNEDYHYAVYRMLYL